MNEEPETYPCPPIARIALTEILVRHQRELQEAVDASVQVSGLPPDTSYGLDMKAWVWVPTGGRNAV